MYSKPYQFSAFHETGHTVSAACFPPPSQQDIATASTQPQISHYVRSLPISDLSDEDDSTVSRVSRIQFIEIWYDQENNRLDGQVGYNHAGLSNEQLLVIKLGGKVAELMVRTLGHWDVTEIQTRFSNHEFDTINIKDMTEAYELLEKINKSSPTKRALSEFVSKAFSFLEEVWDLVTDIAFQVIAQYDRNERKGVLKYKDFPPAIQEQLHQLESSPHLKDI